MKCIRIKVGYLRGMRSAAAAIAILILITPLSAESSKDNYTEIARFLAGMKDSKNIFLEKRAGKKIFREHSKAMDATWRRIYNSTIKKVSSWNKQHLPPVAGKSETVLYPLSGADFINMYLLFGESKRFVMIAMEKPGTVPRIADMTKPRLSSALKSARRTLYWYGSANYFTTAGMKRNMNSSSLKGTLPIVMILMARMGLTIEGIDIVQVNDSGAIVPSENKKNNMQGTPRGYRIFFSDPASPESGKRELMYLSVKLNNDSVNQESPIGKFLNTSGEYKTLLKSAVYLMQMKKYSRLKQFVLYKSTAIIQDDSGIAYGDFDPRSWDISLYGKYRPIPIRGCTVRFQKKLASDFKKRDVPCHFSSDTAA